MSGASVPLTTPIQAHGETVEVLELRAPVVKDLMELGQPFLIIVGDGDPGIQIQQKKVGQYIVRLAGIPMSSVEKLSMIDFGTVQAVVLGFFGTDGDVLPKS